MIINKTDPGKSEILPIILAAASVEPIAQTIKWAGKHPGSWKKLPVWQLFNEGEQKNTSHKWAICKSCKKSGMVCLCPGKCRPFAQRSVCQSRKFCTTRLRRAGQGGWGQECHDDIWQATSTSVMTSRTLVRASHEPGDKAGGKRFRG